MQHGMQKDQSINYRVSIKGDKPRENKILQNDTYDGILRGRALLIKLSFMALVSLMHLIKYLSKSID